MKLNQLTPYIVVEMKHNGHLKYYLKAQLMMLDENNGYTVHVHDFNMHVPNQTPQ